MAARVGLGIAGSGVYHSSYTICKVSTLKTECYNNGFDYSNGVLGAQVPIDVEHILQCLLSDWNGNSGVSCLLGASLEILAMGAVTARFTVDPTLLVSKDGVKSRHISWITSYNQ